jgi:hypothetical protein
MESGMVLETLELAIDVRVKEVWGLPNCPVTI